MLNLMVLDYNVHDVLKRNCTHGKQFTKWHSLRKCSREEHSVKPGFLKVLNSTGEYYEKTLAEEN